MNWEQVLSRRALRELADSRSFSAGESYFHSGAVLGLLVGDRTMTAHVQGTDLYRVQLEIDSAGNLQGDCSCPYGEEGNFCKHCVAVGIAWMESADDPSSSSQPVTVTSIETYLHSLAKDKLVALLLEQVSRDIDLQTRLMLKIAQSSPEGPDIAVYKRSIDQAVSVPGYLEYDEVYEYAEGIDEIIRSLEELCDSGFASEARELAEYAIELAREAMDNLDDSSGSVAGIWQSLHELHLKATLASPGDPMDVAEWLLLQELNAEWDIDVTWQDYLPALGEAGEAQFRQQVEMRWAGVTPLKPGDSESYGSNRYRLTNLMIAFARMKDDLPGIIEIKKRDLSRPHNFLEIAKLYQEADNADSALEWAEKGRAQFPDSPDERLLDYLVELYTQRERYSDAYDILWKRFERNPVLKNYQVLHDYAQARSEWDHWRDQCWKYLRDYLAERRNKQSPPFNRFYSAYDYSEAVTILLWENRNEEAWQEAKAGGCSRGLWLELAKTREITHPEDALRLYKQEIEQRIEPTTNGDYGAPMHYLLKVREIMRRMDEEGEFNKYASNLRATFKRKRNFIKLLDQHKIPV